MVAEAARKVLVTGGSQGIGLGIVERFAAAGAQIVLTSRNQDRADRSAAAVQERFPQARVLGVAAELGDPQACAALVHRTDSLLDGLDVLCSNAGIYPEALLAEQDPAQAGQIITTNLTSSLWLIQAAAPVLARGTHPRIVLTSSITGWLTGLPGFAAYGASKAGQVGLVKTAALELASSGITVNAVLPGNTDTEGLRELGTEYLAQMAAAIPLGRLGTPADIAAAVWFLASAEASFITGQTLVIDGGQTLPEAG